MPRLQFSLRALLLLMAIVGAAIVVYRWPWTETEVEYSGTRVTTFRRGWNGKAVRHGERRHTDSHQIVDEEWYDEGELRRNRVLYKGVVDKEQWYRNGELDGPYFNSSSATRGSYRLGKKHGAWRYNSPFEVVEDEIWRNGYRHGPRTWKTQQGRILQTVEYADGRLTHWNGQPLAEEFRRWVSESIPDTELQQKLLREVVQSPEIKVTLHYNEALFYVGDPPQPLVMQGAYALSRDVPYHGRPIGEALLEDALDKSYLLSYRYGLLQAVQITPQEVDWRDRTGVSGIHFPAGSAAEKYWLSPVDDHQWHPHYPTLRTMALFHHPQSPLEVDTSEINLPDATKISPYPNFPPTFPRIRRDLVGQYLNLDGYTCELRQGKLAILPPREAPRPE